MKRTRKGWIHFVDIVTKDSILVVLVPIIAILLGLVVGGLIMLLSGHQPIEAYGGLLKGAGIIGGSMRRLGNSLLTMTSLVFTGLAVAFAFRTGLFNIGAAGQMLMGGFVGVMLGVSLNVPYPWHMIICVIAACLAGAIWAFLPGFLKAKYNIHEVVTTIMMNWIALWTAYYIIPKYFIGGRNTESARISESASLRAKWLTDLFETANVNYGLFLALIAVVIIWIILSKTTFGYELKAVGHNRDAAKYAGINVKRNIVLSMMISGGLAGLGGAVHYLGFTDAIQIGHMPSQGFDGIVVSLIGLNAPFGVLLSALFFGILNSGKLFMQSMTDVPNELVPIINAMIIFFAATGLMFRRMFSTLRKRVVVSKKKEGK
jgi:general nucleoside transport system permease protein